MFFGGDMRLWISHDLGITYDQRNALVVGLAMGFAVIVPTRRGYGESEGRWAEAYGSCSDPDYYGAGLETARDLKAALDAVRKEPWADTRRVVLAGQSAGGFGSVAASSKPFDGLVAVVNFAGVRPSDVHKALTGTRILSP